MRCFFASDLHGKVHRYEALFGALRAAPPDVLLLGGDLLPGFAGIGRSPEAGPQLGFLEDVLASSLRTLRRDLGARYPTVLAIFGNDDPRAELPHLEALADEGLLEHLHRRRVEVRGVPFYGYAHTPPSPFALKDWERYDVSRYVDPGCVAPNEGRCSVPLDPHVLAWSTIAEELEALMGCATDLQRAVLLFHGPPYRTTLDRADLDGKRIDHVPLDVNVGSIAIRRFIEARQPLLTLHGHIHEAARLSGSWRDTIGETALFGAAHDGEELALVRFDTTDLSTASRELI